MKPEENFPPPEHQLKGKGAKFWDALFPQYGITQTCNQIKITHYRLATFANATILAIEGIKQELTAIHLTTVQNRMAVDILLAKEGGVCTMLGDQCCTYIPVNDDTFSNISIALEQIKQGYSSVAF